MPICEIAETHRDGQVPVVRIVLENGRLHFEAMEGYESFARGVINTVIRGENGEAITAKSDPEKWMQGLPARYSGIYLRAQIMPENGSGSGEDETEDEDIEPIEALDEFEESEHPRVQSGPGAGEFAPKGGGGGAGAKGEKPHGKAASLSPAPASREKWPSHIQKLHLPPTWTDVRISLDPKSDLQAVGKDAKGRPQYVYSERFKNSQAAAKFKRVAALDKKYGVVREKVAKGEQSKDERVREHAECLHLIMETGVRPGSETDTKAEKQAYGATTLLGKHIIEGDHKQVVMKFTGKKGVDLALPVEQPELAEMLRKRAKAVGPDGKLFPEVSAHSLLAYTKSVGGDKFKSKDFRTLLASHLAMDAMKGVKTPENAKEYKAAVKQVATVVSARLGNTPTVALQSYIPPVLFGGWREHAGV